MRDFINIVREGQSETDRLDAVFDRIADYITANSALDDWHTPAAILREFGYKEPITQNRFFRAIFHYPTDSDRAEHATIGDLCADLQREIRFELDRVHGFTTSFDKAVDFIHGQYHIQWDRGEWPTQTPDKTLADHPLHHSVAVIYQVEIDPSHIVWSMRGLITMLKGMQTTGTGYERLQSALDVWDGYGADDEVVIDTAANAKLVGMEPYDTEEHSPANW
jgi:hypothetical protein